MRTLLGCHLPSGSYGCTNRSCCFPYNTSLCIVENLGQEQKKGKMLPDLGGLPSGCHSLFWWEDHTVLLFPLSNGFPLFPVTVCFCCTKGCPVCQVTRAHCGPSPQSYASSFSREVSDMEIACLVTGSNQLEAFVLYFVSAPVMYRCSVNNYCVTMD